MKVLSKISCVVACFFGFIAVCCFFYWLYTMVQVMMHPDKPDFSYDKEGLKLTFDSVDAFIMLFASMFSVAFFGGISFLLNPKTYFNS